MNKLKNECWIEKYEQVGCLFFGWWVEDEDEVGIITYRLELFRIGSSYLFYSVWGFWMQRKIKD